VKDTGKQEPKPIPRRQNVPLQRIRKGVVERLCGYCHAHGYRVHYIRVTKHHI